MAYSNKDAPGLVATESKAFYLTVPSVYQL